MRKAYRNGLWLLAALAAWQLGQGGYIYAKAQLAQYLLAVAWQRTLEGETQSRPWPWADTWPVARLQVPRLGIDQVVLHGATGNSLAFGPGHLDGSVQPGEPGNSILSGHRDTHFAFLRDLEPGDRVSVTDNRGHVRSFRMLAGHIFDTRYEHLTEGDGSPRLLLMTCYPFDSLKAGGPLRYLVELDALDRTSPDSQRWSM